ncbi:hypothetical protein JD844_012007, partial [Phrynosoma platyrhinos]
QAGTKLYLLMSFLVSVCCCFFILFLFLSELTGFIATEVGESLKSLHKDYILVEVYQAGSLSSFQ